MGYQWDGMQKITYEEAVKLYTENLDGVYLLYDDDTEGAAESLDEIENHNSYGGEFGYEK